MTTNIRESERGPRILLAIGVGAIAALVPGLMSRGVLLGGAAALLATVATGYCPVNAALDEGEKDAPHWRTIKTYRVAS
jgi:hypothetical protein